MKYYKVFTLLLMLMLLFSVEAPGKAPVLAQSDQPSLEGETGIYTPESDTPQPPEAITGSTDLVSQGTNWVAERRYNLAGFQPFAWGTVARNKAAGDEWVHMPVTFASYIDGTALKVKKVEFCAKSSAGVQTKPINMHLWANATRFDTIPIVWPADNNYHCFYKDYATPAWRESLGISVQLHFANSTDTITLYKAWVRLVP